MLEVPPLQLDPSTLPSPLMTSEQNSFAYNTFKSRIPVILDEVITLNAFPLDIQRALFDLRTEIVNGTIHGLHEDAPDKGFWDEVSARWYDHTWLQVPWYWAEAFFYRRVLEATRYFQPGDWKEYDPYATKK